MSVVLLKRGNSSLLKKSIIVKVDLDSCSSKLSLLRSESEVLNLSNMLIIKTSLYKLSKQLLDLKLNSFGDLSNCYYIRRGLELQTSKIYGSLVEFEKKVIRKSLVCKFFHVSPKGFSSTNLLCSGSNPAVLRGFGLFNSAFKFNDSVRFDSLLKFLKRRKFFDKLFLVKLTLGLNLLKKKYRYISPFKIVKLAPLFFVFKSAFLRYVKLKVGLKKTYKKLVWRRKKLRNKWKYGSLTRFFRLRHRLFSKFYIPRYFEVNYKTLNFAHLDSFDSMSLNSKITFWLNLRKLTTFLSS